MEGKEKLQCFKLLTLQVTSMVILPSLQSQFCNHYHQKSYYRMISHTSVDCESPFSTLNSRRLHWKRRLRIGSRAHRSFSNQNPREDRQRSVLHLDFSLYRLCESMTRCHQKAPAEADDSNTSTIARAVFGSSSAWLTQSIAGLVLPALNERLPWPLSPALLNFAKLQLGIAMADFHKSMFLQGKTITGETLAVLGKLWV